MGEYLGRPNSLGEYKFKEKIVCIKLLNQSVFHWWSLLMHSCQTCHWLLCTPLLWQAHKFAIVVQLLLGEIPDRATFRQPFLRKTLVPYFKLTQGETSIQDMLYSNLKTRAVNWKVDNFQFKQFLLDGWVTIITWLASKSLFLHIIFIWFCDSVFASGVIMLLCNLMGEECFLSFVRLCKFTW